MSAKTTRYIPKCWDRSEKRKPNLSFIKIIKSSSFGQSFEVLDIHSRNISKSFLLTISSSQLSTSPCNRANLSCKTKYFNFFSVSILQNKQLFAGIKSFLLMLWSVQFIINIFSVFEHNFIQSFIVSCCSLLWKLSTIASAERLFRYGTNIFRYSFWTVSW